MRKLLAIIQAAFFSLTISAQENLHDLMKKALDETSLPLVNLSVDISKMSRDSFVMGELEISDYWRRTDTSAVTVRLFCKLRYRGASATAFDKKSFAVKLVDESGDDFSADLFGIRRENSWILDAMAIDRTRMRNRVCFDVWNAMSRTPYATPYDERNGTEGVFVEVFVNGDYQGLYCLTDKIDRKLLNLKKAKADELGGVEIRGLLYKGISWNDYSDIWLRSYQDADTGAATWNSWELQYPDRYPSVDTWQPLMDLIDFCSEEDADVFATSYEDYFYPDNLVDYVVFTWALNVGDNAYKNTFLSTVDISQAHRYLLTPWDMDMSLGGRWNGDIDERVADVSRYDGVAPFNRLLGDDVGNFRLRLKNRWAELYTTLFAPDSIARRLDGYATRFQASGAWEREVAWWGGNPVPLKASIEEELAYVKDWYRRNFNHLCAHFETDPLAGIGSPFLSPMPPTGIYTLDGRKIAPRGLHGLAKGIYVVNGRKVVVR